MNLTQLVILTIARYILAFPIIAGIRKFKKFTYDLRILFWHLILSGVFQGTISYLSYHKKNNLFLVHGYLVEEVTLMLLFYGSILRDFIPLKWTYTVIVAFALFAIFNAMYLQPLTVHPTNTFLSGSAIILLYVFLSIYERSKQVLPSRGIDLIEYERNKVPFFFINMGIIIYHLGFGILYSFSNIVLDLKLYGISINLWTAHSVLVTIMYTCIGIGLLKFKRANGGDPTVATILEKRILYPKE